MIALASKNGYFDLEGAMMESLISFKRSGADGIFSYFSIEAAKMEGSRPVPARPWIMNASVGPLLRGSPEGASQGKTSLTGTKNPGSSSRSPLSRSRISPQSFLARSRVAHAIRLRLSGWRSRCQQVSTSEMTVDLAWPLGTIVDVRLFEYTCSIIRR